MKTRLDPVVRFREQKEQRALEHLARANDDASRAHARLTLAQAHAQHDGRTVGAAAEWVMADAARERALVDVKRAQDHFEKSSTAVDVARGAWRTEHQQTEAVRRVAEARRAEAMKAQARKDTRALDELGAMMFWRKTA